MPACVVQNEEVLRALKDSVAVSVIQKSLEDFSAGMAESIVLPSLENLVRYSSGRG